jgi:hypothetical protein
MEAHVDGTMQITHQDRTLGFHAITSRPMKAVEAKKVYKPRCPVTPTPAHPWGTRLLPTRETHAAATITGHFYCGLTRPWAGIASQVTDGLHFSIAVSIPMNESPPRLIVKA